jgi:hypothetical protein
MKAKPNTYKTVKLSKSIDCERVENIGRIRRGKTFLMLYDFQTEEILHSECSNPIWLLSKLQSL